MEFKDFDKQLESLAAIDEPIRRKLYFYVAGQGDDVTRDDAARATGVSRSLAAFHLDKLVEAGLLEASFRRLTGRKGPGAGRPSKLYRRASAQFAVQLPERRYELAAHILAQALAATSSAEGVAAVRAAAASWGRRLAEDRSIVTKRGLPLHRAMHALRVCGFEPRRTTEGSVVLRNCPFDSLRSERRELVCGMNLALIEGLLEGLELDVRAELAPREGMCCVALRSGYAPPGGTRGGKG
jgi:predicted ArsR family transcriptional regulator